MIPKNKFTKAAEFINSKEYKSCINAIEYREASPELFKLLDDVVADIVDGPTTEFNVVSTYLECNELVTTFTRLIQTIDNEITSLQSLRGGVQSAVLDRKTLKKSYEELIGVLRDACGVLSAWLRYTEILSTEIDHNK